MSTGKTKEPPQPSREPASEGERQMTNSWIRTAIIAACTAVVAALTGAAVSGSSPTPPAPATPTPIQIAPVIPHITVPEVREVARDEAGKVFDERLQNTLTRIEQKVDGIVLTTGVMRTDIEILKKTKKDR